MSSLKELSTTLRSRGSLVDIFVPVDPCLELPEIHRRVIENRGPALLFHNVVGSRFPVLTNLFGCPDRVRFLFSKVQEDLFAQVAHFLSSPPSLTHCWKYKHLLFRGLSSRLRRYYSVCSSWETNPLINLDSLPLLTSWPKDGGPFLTLPLVYTESPVNGQSNLGMYRMQRFDEHTMGLHFQIQKGGGMHLYEAETLNQNLPVSVFLSGNPFLILSAIAPLPENIPELLFCSFLQHKALAYKKNKKFPHPMLLDAEFILQGECPAHIRKPEGPFGDHFGYYSLRHDFPIFKCKQIYYKKNAIYPATVVGKPYQEDFFLGEQLQKIFSPLFPLIMPGVRKLKSYGEAGFHALAAAVVKERYWKESLTTALRILGEGQLSLTKFLMITDQDIDLEHFPAVLTTILSRMIPSRDLIIFPETSNDTLDYTGETLNRGSKMIMLGVGKEIRNLPHSYSGTALPGVKDIAVYCPGCLLLETSLKDLDIPALLNKKNLSCWPLIILTDNLSSSLDNKNFIWKTFTRSAPASDLYIRHNSITRYRMDYAFPMILNSLMKPSYPEEVLVDEQTARLVSSRWKEYFSNS